jgi:hypothetical protein
LTACSLVWAILHIHEKPDVAWPLILLILTALNKLLALSYYILEEVLRIRRAFRLYRRLTKAVR